VTKIITLHLNLFIVGLCTEKTVSCFLEHGVIEYLNNILMTATDQTTF